MSDFNESSSSFNYSSSNLSETDFSTNFLSNRKSKVEVMDISKSHHLRKAIQTVLPLVFLLSIILPPSQVNCEVFIGRFPSLAHGLQGEVLILNDRQFRIKNFWYDGQGPAVWFMGMKNGTTDIYSADGIALPNHKGTCLNYQRAYRGADITLTLPRRLRVYDLEALSLYCYQYCHNFGHVRIPRNVHYPKAPANLPSLNQCYPKYPPCNPRYLY